MKNVMIRQLPSRGDGQPPEFATEKLFLRDGNQLDCPPLLSGEIVSMEDQEADALLKAIPHTLAQTDAPATRDLVNMSYEEPPLLRTAPTPDSNVVSMAEFQALRKDLADAQMQMREMRELLPTAVAEPGYNPDPGIPGHPGAPGVEGIPAASEVGGPESPAAAPTRRTRRGGAKPSASPLQPMQPLQPVAPLNPVLEN